MDKRTDINTASFAYSVSLLRIRISGYPPGAGTKRQSIHTAVNFKDYSFSKLRERYYEWNSSSMEEKNFESFGIVDGNGKLTNAGALLADNCPIRHSRLFVPDGMGWIKVEGGLTLWTVRSLLEV